MMLAITCFLLFSGTTDPLPTSDIGRIVCAYRQWRGDPAPDSWSGTTSGTGFQPVKKGKADQRQDAAATWKSSTGFQPVSQRQDAAAKWNYQDIPGFAQSATTEEIAKHGHVLTPGRYVGAEDVEEDAEPFAEKYPRLVAEGERLADIIRAQLGSVSNAP